jgi:hypothetical protein
MKKIGFDFDKVFVEYPPFVPDGIIERLYKKKSEKLVYRMPGLWEQKIRILSHHTLLRPPIKSHLQVLSQLKKENTYELYLISSRFSFLKSQTEHWLAKYHIHSFFKEVFFNFEDKQPHEFKNKIIKKLGITDYIDDDLDSLLYLSQKNPSVSFYWLHYNKAHTQHVRGTPIKPVKTLREFVENYL